MNLSRGPNVRRERRSPPQKIMTNSLKCLAVLLTLTHLLPLALRATAFDWPQWRGPDRSGLAKETGLLKTWPESGPKRVWLYEKAGNGYSGPALVNGKMFTAGTRDGNEILIVLDAETGKELWTTKLGAVHDDDRGDGPRGTPTVDGDRVYIMSGPGNLVCVSTVNREVLWQVTMQKLGGSTPRWGFSESVLVDGDQVVCTPGGPQGAVAALDKMTGALRWQSTEFTDPAHYSSIVPARINDTPQYVQRTQRSIVGIAPRDGKLLWQTSFPGQIAVAPTPIVRDNEVYVTAGYGVGCKMVRIGVGNEVTTVYENKVMKNHHGGVVLVGEYLYGHNDPAGWVCQNFKTGEEVWVSKNLGKGAIGFADGMLYCLDESKGTVALIEASPQGWKEHGRFKLEPQTKIRAARGMIWTHPVISNGKLYLRDQDLIYCYDVKGK
jgi:outer membrane protein assembly factor BamB